MSSPSPRYAEAKSEFLSHYESNKERFDTAAQWYESLIRSLVSSELPDVALHSVSSRVKSRDSCLEKFDRKYRDQLETRGDKYFIADYITDIIGVRVVTYYPGDIESVCDLSAKQLQALGETDKIRSLEASENLFGYRAKHLDLVIDPGRLANPENRQYDGLRFELQVRTVVQDAWSVLDHQIKYKKNIPTEMKRRIAMLAALFEMADIQFQELREKSLQFQEKSHPKSLEKDLGGSSAERLDVFSLIAELKDAFPDNNMKPQAVDEFLANVKNLYPAVTLQEFRKSFIQLSTVQRYALENEIRMNDLTKVRHALFASDPVKFERILFMDHASRFLHWLGVEKST